MQANFSWPRPVLEGPVMITGWHSIVLHFVLVVLVKRVQMRFVDPRQNWGCVLVWWAQVWFCESLRQDSFPLIIPLASDSQLLIPLSLLQRIREPILLKDA